MNTPFEVSFTYEIEEGVSMPLRVTGRRTPWIPEVKATMGDPGAPAEGHELEDLKVFCGARLPPMLENMLLADEQFIEAVEKHI